MEKIKLELNPLENGVMLIWEGVSESALYRVKLYARKNCDMTIKEIFECRNSRYHDDVVRSYAKKYKLETHTKTKSQYSTDFYLDTISDDIEIEKNLIDEIGIPKEKCCFSIKDLAQLIVTIKLRYNDTYYKSNGEITLFYDKGYFVEVIAEDRHGNEIAKSDLINFAPGKKENNYVVYGGKNWVCH